MVKTAIRSIVALVGTLVVLAGCVVYDPYPYGYPQPTVSAYDRSWGAALGAIQDQGMQVTEDRANGVIIGRRGGLTTRALLATQADGRVRVEFNTDGNTAEDPALADRVRRSYETRMGR